MIDAEKHLPMVTTVTTNLYKQLAYRYEYNDLFQIGCVGLMQAVNKFDESKGFKFSTYAYKTIWGTIKKTARDDNWYVSKRNVDRMKKSYAPTSLDMPVGKKKNILLIETLPDTNDWESNLELRIAINKLPEDLKKLVVKRYFGQYEYKELMEEFGVSKSTIGQRLKKALRLLREELKE